MSNRESAPRIVARLFGRWLRRRDDRRHRKMLAAMLMPTTLQPETFPTRRRSR